ncbi:phosphoenolpyruvate phosphomutase-domain-containing protein [Microdochium bolleyi]|uniref:Phosphoenolpyruvate phosphomutase-domain-containing protein n=1 Tax=Microdochium bolleyi TaxID=196109 RepID=A0A136J089_9PEZI|nr:phosphoenolpyruvate phosphomutase-domain-containing protein [Microdochium bolleyi]
MADHTTGPYLASLHTPGSPVVFPNVWDKESLQTVLSINDAKGQAPLKAIATASYAIATSLGIKDEELTHAQNLQRIAELAPLVKAANLPLSVDIQDGYGSRIAETVRSVVKAGAVGANIEDVVLADDDDDAEAGPQHKAGEFYGVEEQADRIRAAIQAAEEAGCPGFVVNARCDAFFAHGKGNTGWSEEELVQNAVARGKAYLAAGATTVFFWGGSGRGMRTAEVEAVVKGLEGRVAVKLGAAGGLSVRELADIGVARISVGPSLSFLKPEEVKDVAARILSGGVLVE